MIGSTTEKADNLEKTTLGADVDLHEGDEALRLISAERTLQFSEEYNTKLRRKLVSISMQYLFKSDHAF